MLYIFQSQIREKEIMRWHIFGSPQHYTREYWLWIWKYRQDNQAIFEYFFQGIYEEGVWSVNKRIGWKTFEENEGESGLFLVVTTQYSFVDFVGILIDYLPNEGRKGKWKLIFC